MATISVAIAVRDEIEENRKKQGDIIAIKEGGWQWGSGEVKNHLILEIALPSSDYYTFPACYKTEFQWGLSLNDGIIGKEYQFQLYGVDSNTTITVPARVTLIKGNPTLQIFSNEEWKVVSTEQIFINGEWKSVTAGQIFINGEWRNLV